MTYKIEADTFEEAAKQLVAHFRALNPGLKKVEAVFSGGEKIALTLGKAPKRHPSQIGATLYTTPRPGEGPEVHKVR